MRSRHLPGLWRCDPRGQREGRMFLQDLGESRRPRGDMTATDRFNTALITLAIQGSRPRCSDPVDHQRWTSDHEGDRAIAALWCNGCVLLTLCADAASERGEVHHVWGGPRLHSAEETREPRPACRNVTVALIKRSAKRGPFYLMGSLRDRQVSPSPSPACPR